MNVSRFRLGADPVTWLVALGAPIAGVLVAVVAEWDVSVLLIMAIALALIVPIGWRAATGRFDLFDPLNAFALAWLLMFVVRPIAMIVYDEWRYFFTPAVDLQETFDEMLIIALIGAISFVIGYHLPLARPLAEKLPKPPRDYEPSTVVTICLAATAFALLLFGLFLLQGGGLKAVELISRGRSDELQALLRDSNKYFVLGPVLLVGTTMVTFALAIDLRDRALGILAALSVILVWVIWNSFGSRIILFPLFVGMAICWYLQRNRRPRLLTLVAATVVTMFLSTVISTERQSDVRATQSKAEVALNTLRHPETIIEGATKGVDNTMAPGLAAAMGLAPEQVPRTYGWSMAQDFLVRPIPRALWAGKPKPPRERLIARMDPRRYADRTANPEFSNMLVPYLDFGLLGGLVLILYGIAARSLFEWYRLHRDSLPARLIFGLSLPLMFIVSRDSMVDSFALSVLMAGPIWVAFALGRRATVSPRSPTAAQAS